MRKSKLAALALLFGILAVGASAASLPAKLELAGMPLGSSWAEVSKDIGAQDVKCSAYQDVPSLDSVCTFKFQKSAQFRGMPLQSEGMVGLMGGKVVLVLAAMSKLDASGEAQLQAAMVEQGQAWHMTSGIEKDEVFLHSVPLVRLPNPDARAAALASPAMFARFTRGGTVALALGPLEALQIFSYMEHR